MSRRPVAAAQSWQYLDLDHAAPIVAPADTNVVIHLAANLDAPGGGNQREIDTTRRLIVAAQAVGAHFLFVSSQTAQADAPTAYGRTKWQIEQDVAAAGGISVRLGQVYGGPEAGLFGTLTGLVRSLPLLPALLPSPSIQPVHVDDCALALLTIAERADRRIEPYRIGAAQPLSFTEFLRAIALHRLHVSRLFVPTPRMVLRLAMFALGARISARVGLSRLDSLFQLPRMDTAADLAALNIELRPLHAGMHRSGDDRRRRLLLEARGLLTYVLRATPSAALQRRYVRAVETLRDGAPLILPSMLLHWPALLSLLGDHTFRASPVGRELAWRQDAAAVIGEASPQGAQRFLRSGRTSFIGAIAAMARAVGAEVFWRIFSLCAAPLTRRLASGDAR